MKISELIRLLERAMNKYEDGHIKLFVSDEGNLHNIEIEGIELIAQISPDTQNLYNICYLITGEIEK